MMRWSRFASAVVWLQLLQLQCHVRGQNPEEEGSSRSTFSEAEQLFLSMPNATFARRNLRYITSKPHVAGTDGDLEMARFVSNEFKASGIPNVSTFDLDVMLTYPSFETSNKLSMVSSSSASSLRRNGGTVLFEASLSEDILDFDDTSDTLWRNHTFHGFSPSGTIRGAPAIYANYGRPQDFDALKKAGVTVEGTVVIVRYGECFRGLKVMNAQERGALGVLMYSDPADDGFGQGSIYPKGPWRPASGIQRGSVQFISKCAGDPVRADPRYNTTALQDLCGVKDSTDLIPSIPSIPIGYGDALPILQNLGGKTAREVGGDDFVGDLKLEYTVGPSSSVDAFVHLEVHNRAQIKSIPNVVGHIPGSLPPEQDMPILLGNHRDAWVFGAADPNSGTASLLEVARGLGKLVQTGWKPLRSIYLLSWSGEEYGLLGSTGWAELNPELIQRATAYLNVDTVVSGDLLSVSATPSLVTAWKQVLADLHTTTEPHHHYMPFQNGPLGEIRDTNTGRLLNPENNNVNILGSGSDYTVFLDHFGISSLDFSFGKSTAYGQYHSIYDSFAWMDAYGGVEGKAGSAFDLMAFAAKIWGLLALRLADSVVLPFDHSVQGNALSDYVTVIENQHTGLDMTTLNVAIQQFQNAAATLQAACQLKDNRSTLLHQQACNEKLGLTERQFISEEGLPERPWFKHILQAPGMYLGYAAEAFPGIQQSIDANDLDLAQKQVFVATERVQAAASFMQIKTDEEMSSHL